MNAVPDWLTGSGSLRVAASPGSVGTTVYQPETSNWLAPAQDWFAPSVGPGGSPIMSSQRTAGSGAPFGISNIGMGIGSGALNLGLSGFGGLSGLAQGNSFNLGTMPGADFGSGSGALGGVGAGLSNALVGGVLAHTGLEKNAGGQIGGAIGSLALTPFLGPLGPVAGAAVGSMFGNRPTAGPNATAGYDFASGAPWGNSGDNGGNSNMLSGWLGNQIADAAARGGLSGISNIQYGNNPGNHGGPLNQFAVYMQGNPNPYVIQAGGFRQDAQGNVLDQDPNELIRGLVENGLAPQSALDGLGPRKLMMTAADYQANMLANGFPVPLNATGIYDKGQYMPWAYGGAGGGPGAGGGGPAGTAGGGEGGGAAGW